MKAHIFGTPEFSYETINEVAKILNSNPGLVQFEPAGPMSIGLYKKFDHRFNNMDEIIELEFEEFFFLLDAHRDAFKKDIMEDDFVILISTIGNTNNWFSAFKGRDIFIHDSEWDFITNIDSKFELAYQCIENIFQSLIYLHVNEYHETSIGCINDFCRNKSEILLKLQSGNICPKCFERAKNYGLNDLFFSQLIHTLETIRKEFVISKRFSEEVKLDPVEVKENGEIWIGEKQIDMEFRLLVLYLGFLNNPVGIPSPPKCDNSKIFEKIYKELNDNPKESAIQMVFCKEIKGKSNNPKFLSYKTKVNDALKLSLGEPLSNFYEIHRIQEDNKFFFRVNPKNYKIKFPPKFTKSARY